MNDWKCKKCGDINDFHNPCDCGNQGILARKVMMKKRDIITIKDIREALESIKEQSNDSDVAHSMEDELLIDTLISIQNGAENPVQLAKETLKVLFIDYSKYYA